MKLLGHAIKHIILFTIVILPMSIIFLFFFSPFITNHFYIWVDNLSSPHMEISTELISENIANNQDGSLKYLNTIFTNHDNVSIVILKDNQNIYNKPFSGSYMNLQTGKCISIARNGYTIELCSPKHRNSHQTLVRYLECLLNKEVFTKYKYTDYLLLHVAMIFLIYSVFNSVRIARKNVLLKKVALLINNNNIV